MHLWDIYDRGRRIGTICHVSKFAALEAAYLIWGYGRDLRVFAA